MRPLPAQADYLQLVIYDDDQTPQDFVVGLVRSVFGQSSNDANSVMATVERRGKAVCGTYPRAVAEALLQTARRARRGVVRTLRCWSPAEAGDNLEQGCVRIVRSRLCRAEPASGSAGKIERPSATTASLAVASNVGDITRNEAVRLCLRRRIGVAFRRRPSGPDWSRLRGSFPGTCAPTCRRRWTNCSRPPAYPGSSAFRSATATRR